VAHADADAVVGVAQVRVDAPEAVVARVAAPRLDLELAGARSISSWITVTSGSATLRKRAASATDLPESFIKVWGLRRRTRSPPIVPSTARPAKRARQGPSGSARRSTAMKPTLWRFWACFAPGLPRPTMSFMGPF
jgi:hypothetical protein